MLTYHQGRMSPVTIFGATIQMPYHVVSLQLFEYRTAPLAHWGRDKMAAKFADDIFKCIFFNENIWI